MITKIIKIPHKPQRFKLNEDQRFLLMPVGDIHYGSHGWPKNKFLATMKWAHSRGAYFLGMGDPLELTPTSQRKITDSMRDSTQEVFDQDADRKVEELAELMKFTKGKWLGMLEGNHRWIYQDGTSTDQKLCKLMGCDFLGSSTFMRFQMEGIPKSGDVTLFAHHGRGGGSTIGGQLLKPEHLLKFSLADLVLMGHSHGKLAGAIDKLYLSTDNVLYHKTTIVARTGAFLKAYEAVDPLPLTEPAYLSRGSYVEEGAMMPSSMGSVCFSIGATKVNRSVDWRPVIHWTI